MRNILAIGLLSVLTACGGVERLDGYVWNRDLHVLPAPERLAAGEGAFVLRPAMKLYVPEGLEGPADLFLAKVNASTGLALERSAVPEGSAIVVELAVPKGKPASEAEGTRPEGTRSDGTGSATGSPRSHGTRSEGTEGTDGTDGATGGWKAEESYRMEITPAAVRIAVSAAHGLHNALATLLQLFPAEVERPALVRAKEWKLPCVSIEDAPRFEYRGVMLDVARHFLSAEDLKRQIEVFSSLKINRLHLHLTDNQGWRIEIRSYPRLTDFGAYRVEHDGSSYGGYYTQEEMKEVVRYAAARFVEIVPEIDIPAHAEAAMVSYPELSCTEEIAPVRSVFGPDPLVMCPGKELMFEFLDKVFAELSEIFPSRYFHIGGDECPKRHWKNCMNCQERIRKEHLDADGSHSPEEQLQGYTMRRVERLLVRYGRKVIGWDEILSGGLSPTATVMCWRGENTGIRAARDGNSVIMTPQNKGMYFDHYQGSCKVEPVQIGGFAPLRMVYKYDPVPAQLVREGLEDKILGVQASLWSEYMYSTEMFEYSLYPRTMALAEIGWSQVRNKNFEDFCRRLENSVKRLDYKGFHFHIPLPEMVGGALRTVCFQDSVTLAFRTSRPVRVVYTVNGRNPDPRSKTCDTPLTFRDNATLKVASVMENGLMSKTLEYKIRKVRLRPAVEAGRTSPGLRMTRYPQGRQSLLRNIEYISEKDVHPRHIRYIEHFTNVAEGFIDIPEDGIWCFSTTLNRLWIDEELLIDNSLEVKHFCRNDTSAGLAAGLHRIRFEFVSGHIGGYPSTWEKGNLVMKKAGRVEFRPVPVTRLLHEETI